MRKIWKESIYDNFFFFKLSFITHNTPYMNRFDFIRYLFEDCHIIQQFCKDATQCSSAICIIKNQNEKNNRTKNNINQSKEIVFSKKSVFVIL